MQIFCILGMANPRSIFMLCVPICSIEFAQDLKCNWYSTATTMFSFAFGATREMARSSGL